LSIIWYCFFFLLLCDVVFYETPPNLNCPYHDVPLVASGPNKSPFSFMPICFYSVLLLVPSLDFWAKGFSPTPVTRCCSAPTTTSSDPSFPFRPFFPLLCDIPVPTYGGVLPRMFCPFVQRSNYGLQCGPHSPLPDTLRYKTEFRELLLVCAFFVRPLLSHLLWFLSLSGESQP